MPRGMLKAHACSTRSISSLCGPAACQSREEDRWTRVPAQYPTTIEARSSFKPRTLARSSLYIDGMSMRSDTVSRRTLGGRSMGCFAAAVCFSSEGGGGAGFFFAPARVVERKPRGEAWAWGRVGEEETDEEEEDAEEREGDPFLALVFGFLAGNAFLLLLLID